MNRYRRLRHALSSASRIQPSDTGRCHLDSRIREGIVDRGIEKGEWEMRNLSKQLGHKDSSEEPHVGAVGEHNSGQMSADASDQTGTTPVASSKDENLKTKIPGVPTSARMTFATGKLIQKPCASHLKKPSWIRLPKESLKKAKRPHKIRTRQSPFGGSSVAQPCLRIYIDSNQRSEVTRSQKNLTNCCKPYPQS